jgi:hypothetical protein
MKDLTKAQKRELRRLAGLAYERELSAASANLQGEFERWRKGEIDVFMLNELIHQFHDGVARDLYKLYAMGQPVWGVGAAIARGVLKKEEVNPVILEYVQGPVEFAREYGTNIPEDDQSSPAGKVPPSV